MAFSATMTIENGTKYTLKQLLEGNRVATERAVRFWHRQFLPRHFTAAGGKMYGYQKRKGDDEPPRLPNPKYQGNKNLRFRTTPTIANWHYSWRKRKVKKHNKPLVWSGASERMARSSIRIKFKRDGASGEIHCLGVMQVPNYFYKYRKAGISDPVKDATGRVKRGPQIMRHTQPDKFKEMTLTTEAEKKTLLDVVNRELVRFHRGLRREKQVYKVA